LGFGLLDLWGSVVGGAWSWGSPINGISNGGEVSIIAEFVVHVGIFKLGCNIRVHQAPKIAMKNIFTTATARKVFSITEI